jgi:hypothetical protein
VSPPYTIEMKGNSMKKFTAVAVLAIAFAAGSASAATAGEWTCQNPAGNQVNGQCNGQPLEVVNPGGNIPPGQNK